MPKAFKAAKKAASASSTRKAKSGSKPRKEDIVSEDSDVGSVEQEDVFHDDADIGESDFEDGGSENDTHDARSAPKAVAYNNGLMDELPWKESRVKFDNSFDEHGFYGLEEIPADSYELVKNAAGGFKILMKGEKAAVTAESKKKSKKEKPSKAAESKDNAKIPKEVEAVDAENDEATAMSGRKRGRAEMSTASDDEVSVTSKMTSATTAKTGSKHVKALPSTHSSLPLQTVTDSWGWMDMHPSLLQAIARLGFSTPTDIQQQTIPTAIREYKDVVGAAATGSGKTLAYSLPILHRLLERRATLGEGRSKAFRWRHLPALILTPTRELAVQVCDHINAVMEDCAGMRAVAIVGGFSIDKQKRQLNARPDIVVATPGRFWDLASSGTPYLAALEKLQFLVLDEADRLCEKGHFQALTSILNNMKEKSKGDPKLVDPIAESIIASKVRFQVDEDEKADDDDGVETPAHYRRQTFLFSATLGVATALSIKEAAESLVQSQAAGKQVNKAKMKKALEQAKKLTPVEALMARVGLLGKPIVVKVEHSESYLLEAPVEGEVGEGDGEDDRKTDKSAGTMHTAVTKRTAAGEVGDEAKVALPPGLRLCRLTCVEEEKDQTLYYFLLRYPGRTLIFVNAIATLKRLFMLLSVLKLPVITLHASMQQRQRISHLEKFRANPNAILLATDVAARGLDVPMVQYVLHYSLPHTAEMFVHRCGRTARAASSGLSAALISPKDSKQYSKIMSVVGLDVGLPEFPVELPYMRRIVSRLSVARKLTTTIIDVNKTSSGQHFVVKTAKRSGLTLDAELAKELGMDASELADLDAAGDGETSDAEDKQPAGKRKRVVEDVSDLSDDDIAEKQAHRKGQNAAIKSLRRELDELLRQPLLPSGVSTKYITSNPLLNQASSFMQDSVRVDTTTQAAMIGNALVAPRVSLPDFSGTRGGSASASSASSALAGIDSRHSGVLAISRSGAIDVLSQKGKHVHVPAKKGLSAQHKRKFARK